MSKERGTYLQKIQERLKEEGISVTIKSLYLLVAKYRQTKSVLDRSRNAVPKILRTEH